MVGGGFLSLACAQCGHGLFSGSSGLILGMTLPSTARESRTQNRRLLGAGHPRTEDKTDSQRTTGLAVTKGWEVGGMLASHGSHNSPGDEVDSME